jgi:tryptophan-rich sensory protein
MTGKFVIFLLINFAALAIGGLFTGKGVSSEWYAELNKAPWTPPGWVFGAAWTVIMICFAFFMAYAHKATENSKLLIGLFAVQWILNTLWNPTFFYYQNVLAGLIVISALTLLIAYLFINYLPVLKLKSIFLLPYLLWLIIATSLNAYIFLKN